METEKTNSKGMLWTGRIITALCVLFLIVDGGYEGCQGDSLYGGDCAAWLA
jgi:hypothetical protein